MKKTFFPWTLLLMIGLALGAVGCSDDNDDDNSNPTGPNDDNSYTLDATDYETWAYFNLETGQEVSGQLAATEEWHVAFRRSEGKLNGGVSGDLGVRAANLHGMGHQHGQDFDMVNSMPMMSEDDWMMDHTRLVLDAWYNYDFQTHEVSPTNNVFIVRNAAGTGYAKLMVTGVTAVGQGMLGQVDISYVYNPDGTDLSGEVQEITLSAGGSNSVFWSFANGEIADVANPESSMEWDIWFDGFEAHINGGVSGPGDCGVFPAYDDPDYDEFAEVSDAPQNVGAGYEQDMVESVFSDWYEYDGQTHELKPSHDVYLIDVNDAYYKFTIDSYYNQDDGTSGFINFRYAELQ